MAPYFEKIRYNPLLANATRFAAVGLLGTLIDFTLFSVASMLLHLPALIANTISYSAGIVNNYYFHRTWTFAQREQKSSARLFVKFLLVSITALALNNLIVLTLVPLLTAHLSDPALATGLAKMCAIVIGVGWNFIANHAWTFRT